MHDANEMECLIIENTIKNILLGKVTKSGVSDANNILIIKIFQMWGHIDPIRSGIGLKKIISNCESYAQDYYITFYPAKLKLLCFNVSSLDISLIYLNGTPVTVVDKDKHFKNIYQPILLTGIL